MKLGKHAVKVLAVFAVLFVVGFALKFLNLHEGFNNKQERLEKIARKYVTKSGKFKNKQWEQNTQKAASAAKAAAKE